jgi:hypothetical protein
MRYVRAAPMSGGQASDGTPVGGACGYYTSISLFGGPAEVRGCGQRVPPGNRRSSSPSVKLPRGGSTTPVSKTDDNGALAQYGPAVIFGGKPPADPNLPVGPSGPLTVRTRGKRSVTSSASVKNVGAGPFTANSVRSECNASKTGVKATTTISNGVVITATDADGNPTSSETVPARPPVNHTVTGVNNMGDTFRAVFNEQQVDADGRITVSAVHLYLLGPMAVGDVVIAQSHART